MPFALKVFKKNLAAEMQTNVWRGEPSTEPERGTESILSKGGWRASFAWRLQGPRKIVDTLPQTESPTPTTLFQESSDFLARVGRAKANLSRHDVELISLIDSSLQSPSQGGEGPLDKGSVLKELDDLKELQANWNGYGASPIDREIIQTAKNLVVSLPAVQIAAPQVVPMTRGRLQFEWHRGSRSLELEFESPTTLHYLKCDPAEALEEEDVLSITQTRELHDLLIWFASE